MEDTVPADTSTQSNDTEWLGEGSRGVESERLVSSAPLCEVAHRLQMHIIKAVLLGHGGHFEDDLL